MWMRREDSNMMAPASSRREGSNLIGTDVPMIAMQVPKSTFTSKITDIYCLWGQFRKIGFVFKVTKREISHVFVTSTVSDGVWIHSATI